MAIVFTYVFNGLSLILGIAGGLLIFRLPNYVGELRPVFRSVIFQAALAVLSFYVTTSARSLLVSMFLLTALGVSFFQQYRDWKGGGLAGWFSPFKRAPTRAELIVYFLVISVLFLYSVLDLIS